MARREVSVKEIYTLPFGTIFALLIKGFPDYYCLCRCKDIKQSISLRGIFSIFYKSINGIECTDCHIYFPIEDLRSDLSLVIIFNIIAFPSIIVA